MAHSLDNYLRTYRKRTGLSQEEVAFLLGCEDGGVVSRFERKARQPALKTVCAFELILGTSARELFRGTYEKVDQEITRRAKLLARRKLGPESSPQAQQRRLDVLRRIASGSATRPVESK